jgi:hypothetical protein
MTSLQRFMSIIKLVYLTDKFKIPLIKIIQACIIKNLPGDIIWNEYFQLDA